VQVSTTLVATVGWCSVPDDFRRSEAKIVLDRRDDREGTTVAQTRGMKSKLGLMITCALLGATQLGCDVGDVGCVTGSTVETVCTVKGGGTATSSNGSATAPLAFSSFDDGCNGSCRTGFSAFFNTSTFTCLIDEGGTNLSPGTAALTASNVFCNEAGAQQRSLTVSSGSLTIERVDDVSLSGSFSLELATPDGDTISITNGTLSIGGCHDAQVCTF
jgi:hypothetical protein